MRFVTIQKFAAQSGYTEDAIRSKIKRGDWIQGHEWRRAPDGRTLIDISGVEAWVIGKGSGRSRRLLTN